jgi:hypothetical protein
MSVITRNGKTAEYGVRQFEGAIFSRPYGWAQSKTHYREGPLRWTKFRARLDAKRLAEALTKP